MDTSPQGAQMVRQWDESFQGLDREGLHLSTGARTTTLPPSLPFPPPLPLSPSPPPASLYAQGKPTSVSVYLDWHVVSEGTRGADAREARGDARDDRQPPGTQAAPPAEATLHSHGLPPPAAQEPPDPTPEGLLHCRQVLEDRVVEVQHARVVSDMEVAPARASVGPTARPHPAPLVLLASRAT